MSRFNNLPRNLREVTRNQDAVYKLPYEGKRSNLACVNEFFVRLCCVRIKWNYRGLVVYYLLGVEEGGGGRPFWESLFKVVLKDQHLYFSRLSPQTIARTIVLYHRKYYWLFIFMLNLVLLMSIYSFLTACILCSFDLNRLDRWIGVGSKNYANQCPAWVFQLASDRICGTQPYRCRLPSLRWLRSKYL